MPMCELVSIRKSSRKLRSSSQIVLQVPVSRLMSCGDYGFNLAASTLWNRLLLQINNYYLLNHLQGFYRHIISGINKLDIICTTHLNGYW